MKAIRYLKGYLQWHWWPGEGSKRQQRWWQRLQERAICSLGIAWHSGKVLLPLWLFGDTKSTRTKNTADRSPVKPGVKRRETNLSRELDRLVVTSVGVEVCWRSWCPGSRVKQSRVSVSSTSPVLRLKNDVLKIRRPLGPGGCEVAG